MATVAELLGSKADVVRRTVGAPAPLPKGTCDPIHYMAAGLPGAPLSKDSAGRVRCHGKFVAKPGRPR